ncbi:MAG: spsI 2 [Firmicutes bacterium]|nr:spsI 2 [Bacillota bacterium]
MKDYRSTIAEAMRKTTADIRDISPMKKGMTNLSYRFSIGSKEYVLRIPGKGTAGIIDRQKECDVYQVLKDKGISENVVYISAANGYKISECLRNARPCDPSDISDVRACMTFLRGVHEKELSVNHSVDIFERIGFYESLLDGTPSPFKDYSDTKKKVFKLKALIEALPKSWSLTHMDAVPDNFLFTGDKIRLIDWEYAAMQDPHVDIAMFALYSVYDRAQVDMLIDCYFAEGCDPEVRFKIYCYIAACGLLCSNWCEYRRLFGEEFGEYSRRQYAYAKEYFEIAVHD